MKRFIDILAMHAVCAVGFAAPVCMAQTQTVGDDTGGYASLSWDQPLCVSGYVVPPYARLSGIDYRISGSNEVTASVRNNSSFQTSVSINGNGTTTFSRAGGTGTLGILRLFPFGSTTVGPMRSGTVTGFGNDALSGSIPASEFGAFAGPGQVCFQVMARGNNPPTVSGAVVVNSSNHLALAGIQITYTFQPIGLSQGDPILPSSTQNGVFTFSQVPSGRWFDPNPASAFRFDMVSAGDSFTRVVDFPTGHGGDFGVFVDGSPIGRFAPTQAADLPVGVRSFVVQGISPMVSQGDPRAFPIQLAFNRDGVTFTMRPLCPADANFDGGVTVDDLIQFLGDFESGDLRTDLDDGAMGGRRDGGVTVDDLLYYLSRYALGC